VKTTYTVLWQESDGPSVSGTLELLPLGFRFAPSDGSRSPEELHYEDIAALRIGTSSEDDWEGKPVLVVERRAAAPIRFIGTAEPMLASELARDLAALALGGEMRPRRLLVVAPLKQGEVPRARQLLQAGPPFDPQEAGLERHETYLTQREAIFVFETLDDERALEEIFSSATVWAAAPAWRELIDGMPRIAEVIYTWKRSRLEIKE
jgi:hypothetical protein